MDASERENYLEGGKPMENHTHVACQEAAYGDNCTKQTGDGIVNEKSLNPDYSSIVKDWTLKDI